MQFRNSPPAVLLVGGASPTALGTDIAATAIEQARARALRVHIVTGPAGASAVNHLADAVHVVDLRDPHAVTEWTLECARRGTRFDVVFGIRERALPAAARIAELMGVPGNPPDVIDLVQDKDRCRRHLAAAGFRQPAVHLFHDLAGARRWMAGRPGPWVVKPRTGSGSAGVRMVDSPDLLPDAMATLPSASPGTFLIEEFVPGTEYSVEGGFVAGEPQVFAITAKEKLPPPFFVESGHTVHARLPEAERDAFSRVVCSALGALGLRFGLFHVELWHGPDGVVLGEVHARNGGGYIHRLLANALDRLELFGTVFDDAMNVPVRTPVLPTAAASCRYLTPPPGRVEAIEGWEEVTSHPAVIASEMNIGPGDVISPYRSSNDRVGAVAVRAGTPDEAQRLAGTLTGAVRFRLRPVR